MHQPRSLGPENPLQAVGAHHPSKKKAGKCHVAGTLICKTLSKHNEANGFMPNRDQGRFVIATLVPL
jgi:hypothetical protein